MQTVPPCEARFIGALGGRQIEACREQHRQHVGTLLATGHQQGGGFGAGAAFNQRCDKLHGIGPECRQFQQGLVTIDFQIGLRTAPKKFDCKFRLLGPGREAHERTVGKSPCIDIRTPVQQIADHRNLLRPDRFSNGPVPLLAADRRTGVE